MFAEWQKVGMGHKVKAKARGGANCGHRRNSRVRHANKMKVGERGGGRANPGR